jgi:hypothetical protein
MEKENLVGFYSNVSFNIEKKEKKVGYYTGDLYVFKNHFILGKAPTWYRLPVEKLKKVEVRDKNTVYLEIDKYVITISCKNRSLASLQYFLESYIPELKKEVPVKEVLRLWALDIKNIHIISEMLMLSEDEIKSILRFARLRGLIIGEKLSDYAFNIFSTEERMAFEKMKKHPVFPYKTIAEKERKISAAIKNSSCPKSEVRKFLRNENIEEITKTPVFMFLQKLFMEIGLGTLKLIEAKPFHYTFNVKFHKMNGKKEVCYMINDFLSEFFSKDLGVSCTSKVEDIADDYCKLMVELQPIDTYVAILDKGDIEILSLKNIVSTKHEKEIRIMQRYKLIDEKCKLTEFGKVAISYAKYIKPEKVVTPPWKLPISSVLSLKDAEDVSFDIITRETLPWEKSGKILDITNILGS